MKRKPHTPGALSHDHGGRGTSMPPHTTGVRVDSIGRVIAQPGQACHWPTRWRAVAVEILAMPVPKRDEPVAVSGARP